MTARGFRISGARKRMKPELDPAIQQDADGINGDEIIAKHVQPVNHRDEAMNAVLARQRRDRGQPSDEAGDDDKAVVLGAKTTGAADNEVDDGNDDAAATQLAAQLRDDDRSTVIDLESMKDKKVKVKIDGVEKEVSFDQVVRSFQKDGAADNRLRDANDALRRATELEERLKVRDTAAAAPAAAKATETNADANAKPDVAATRKKFIDAMFSGDEEAAGAAFDEAVAAVAGRGNATTLDPQALVQQALPALKQQMDIDSALTEFQSKYAQLDADPHLARRVAEATMAKIAEGMSHRDALMASGAETLDWIRSIGGAPKTADATATTQQMTDRQTRKQSHSESIVTGAAGKVGSDKAQPTTRQSVIDEMRASRGQNAG